MRYFSHYNRQGQKINSSVELGDEETTELNETQPNTNQHTTISSTNQDGSTNEVSQIGSARVKAINHDSITTSPAQRIHASEAPLTSARRTSATRRLGTDTVSPAHVAGHLKLPPVANYGDHGAS